MPEVAIIGGSVAGLTAGRELASQGVDAIIFEEHREIGIPEKCDGLVSMSGMSELGLVPPSSVVQNSFAKAVFFSPSMREVEIDARKQNVIVLDRSRFDKYLAERAVKEGARLELGKRVSGYSQKEDKVTLKVDSAQVDSKFLLDCSGSESYISDGGKTLQGGQYLVYGNWFEKSKVEVYLDPKSAPAFFKWVIPISNDIAKIGVAGDEINTFGVLEQFVKEKGAKPIRKSAAPVIAAGSIKTFVNGRVAKAGDAAGQTKPTTGGGIYTGGYGGLLCGRATAKALNESRVDILRAYENEWRSRFDQEFKLQLRARNLFAKLDSRQVDQLIEMVKSSDLPKKISEEGDFDKHSIAIIKAFGLTNLVSTFGMIFVNEMKNFIS